MPPAKRVETRASARARVTGAAGTPGAAVALVVMRLSTALDIVCFAAFASLRSAHRRALCLPGSLSTLPYLPSQGSVNNT